MKVNATVYLFRCSKCGHQWQSKVMHEKHCYTRTPAPCDGKPERIGKLSIKAEVEIKINEG